MRSVGREPLTRFVAEVCIRMGADTEVADEVATHLVRADLSGHGSHGVQRLRQYVDEADRGDLVPSARPEVVRGRGAATLVDAGRGFGHYSTRFACEAASRAAERYGVATVVVRRSGHTGRLGHYCERIAEAGLVGLLTVGAAGPSVGAMVLGGTAQRFLAANPWAIGVPATPEAVVVDVSSAMLAEGKVVAAAMRSTPLPEGCVVDAARRPSRDPVDYFDGGGLLPLGGLVAGHKGFGLGLAAALLGGLAMIDDDRPTLAGSQRPPGSTGEGEIAGVCLVVIDPDVFGGREPYAAAVSRTTDHIVRAEADGATVTVPGVPESRHRAANRARVPVVDRVLADLVEIGERYGVGTDLDGEPE